MADFGDLLGMVKMSTQVSLTMSFRNPSMVKSIFFIIFITHHVSVCVSQDAHEDFKACSVYYNCGELVNITYPFWGNNQPLESCGRPKFGLHCKDNKTTSIVINDQQFNVLNINQTDNRMTIARSDLLEDYCPKEEIETATMDESVFRYSWNSRNISVWYNCNAEHGVGEEFRFECEHGGANYAFEAEEEDMNLGSHSIRGCTVKIQVMIMENVVEEGRKNRTMMMERGLRDGFDVEYGDWYTTACDGCRDSGGNCGGNSTQMFFCICGNGLETHPHYCNSVLVPAKSNAWKKKAIIIGATASGSTILILSIIITISIKFTRKNISNRLKIEEIIKTYSTQTPKRYSYSKLKKITDSFKNKLGQGGFSTVYRGKLPGGHDVAVKLLKEFKDNGQDFMNEVVSITKASHVNVVTLLGFCYEGKKRALIYEYMPKGSLDKYISPKGLQKNDVKLDWNTLYNILIGVARGLEYLHRGCNTRILHFDIKPHNILLDNDFCPKISDFGLAKQCLAKESHVSMTGVKGTAGFIAPEVIFRNFGKVSHKSDVYSYGMLVLEMVGERKNPNEGMGESSEEYFPDWIYKNLREDERNGGCGWSNTEEEEEMTRKMIIVGLHCIQTMPDDRPSMTDVVVMLEGSVDALQIPAKPNMLGPPVIEQPQLCSSSSSKSY